MELIFKILYGERHALYEANRLNIKDTKYKGNFLYIMYEYYIIALNPFSTLYCSMLA